MEVIIPFLSFVQVRKAQKMEKNKSGVIPLFFIHIGKTGGCSLKDVLHDKLYKSNDGKQYMLIDFGHDAKLEKGDLKNLRRLLIKYKYRLIDRRLLYSLCSSEVYFFFVRNPISRFVSAFQFSMVDDTHNKQSCANIRKKYGVFTNANHLAESLYSNDETIKQLARNAMDDIYHMDGITRYLLSVGNVQANVNKIFFVGRFEFFNEDIKELCKMLNSPCPAAIPHHNKLSYQCNLSNEAKYNLKKWYQTDYDIIKALIELGKIDTTYMDVLTCI